MAYDGERVNNNNTFSLSDGRRDCGALLPRFMDDSLLEAVTNGDVILAKASYYLGELAGGVYFVSGALVCTCMYMY